MDFTEILDLLKSLPAEVVVPALGIFIVIGVLKAVGVVGNDLYSQLMNVALAFFASGGLDINDVEGTLTWGATGIAAAILYQLWKPLSANYVSPAVAGLTKRLNKDS